MRVLYSHVHRLWLFSLIAQLGSFRRAALRAGITQSALSQQLTALEKALGHALVIRARTGLSLTDEGKQVAADAAPILAGLDAMSSRAGVYAAKPTTLRLGAYESVALTWIPQSFEALVARNRDLDVQLRMGRASLLQSWVREGSLDMAILDHPAAPPLDSVPLADSRMGLYRSSSAPMPGGTEGVLRVGSILYPNGEAPAYFEQFVEFHERYFATRGVALRAVVKSDSLETLQAMAIEGQIVALLPEHVAERAGRALVEIEIEGRPAECCGQHTLHLASGRHANRRLRDAVQAQFARRPAA